MLSTKLRATSFAGVLLSICIHVFYAEQPSIILVISLLGFVLVIAGLTHSSNDRQRPDMNTATSIGNHLPSSSSIGGFDGYGVVNTNDSNCVNRKSSVASARTTPGFDLGCERTALRLEMKTYYSFNIST